MTSIRTTDLNKGFGGFRAGDNISFELPEDVRGFVGPNGAGKSTTIRMLLGLIRPTGGGGEVLGCPTDPSTYLHRVRALIEAPAFYPALSGEEKPAGVPRPWRPRCSGRCSHCWAGAAGWPSIPRDFGPFKSGRTIS